VNNKVEYKVKLKMKEMMQNDNGKRLDNLWEEKEFS
jgi:hypothetical protein